MEWDVTQEHLSHCLLAKMIIIVLFASLVKPCVSVMIVVD
jgi:hypothetical protein